MLVKQAFNSGGSGKAARDSILEYNPEDEEWQSVGTMMRPRSFHAVSIVDLKDYELWCINE